MALDSRYRRDQSLFAPGRTREAKVGELRSAGPRFLRFAPRVRERVIAGMVGVSRLPGKGGA